MPQVVVIFYGRFQPPSAAHVAVYEHLTKKFGSKSVYIGTSSKTDPEKSPLSFEQKKKIWIKHGVPANNIVKTVRNYNAEELQQELGLKDFVFIVAIGQKDAARLSGGKFYQQLKTTDTSKLQTVNTTGYYYIIPNITMGGTVLSATDIRKLLRQPKISKSDMVKLQNMTRLKPRDIVQVKKLFEFSARRRWWAALLEGGAGGHLQHPFEDLTMTFSDLKKLIKLAFEGKLQLASEGPITEKVDGQNLFASVIDDKVRFARNKGQLKNRGKTSMTTMDIESKWKDIPQVRAAFTKAALTLQSGFDALSKNTKLEIFRNGQNWVNFELVAQDNPNVINYDADVIIFHNIQMVDEDGNKTGIASAETKKLFKIFSDAQRSAKLSMKIRPPQIVKADKNLTIDFSSEQSGFMSAIDRISKSAGLNDNNTFGDMLMAMWRKDIAELEKKHAMDLKPDVAKKLSNRFVFGDKKYRVTDWPRDIPDAAFLDDLKKIDRDALKINKEYLQPIELLVLKFSVILLNNIDTFISANPDNSVQQLRKAIAQQIASIRKSKDVSSVEQMMGILKKIEALGGFDNLVPSEGIVFRYNDKLYKLTGLFAPVNQLMGIGRFS